MRSQVWVWRYGFVRLLDLHAENLVREPPFYEALSWSTEPILGQSFRTAIRWLVRCSEDVG